MFNKFLLSTMILFASQSFATKIVCNNQISANTKQVILISESVIMICQGANNADFNDQTKRSQMCTAAMTLMTSSGKTSSINSTQYSLILQSISPLINDFISNLVVAVTYSSPAGVKDKAAVEIGLKTPTSTANESSILISKQLNLSLNKKLNFKECTLK